MIKVTIELESARTGESTVLGRMYIWNRGDGTAEIGNYGVAVCRKGKYDVPFGQIPAATTRKGKVLGYPRLAYNVWRLIMRALRDCFPEEGR